MDPIVKSKIVQFYSQYPSRSWPEKQILVQAFDNPQGIYFLEQGSIAQYAIDYRGNRVVVNIFRAPAMMPLSWAMNDVDNEYFFETIDDVVVRLAPKEAALTFIKENPEVTYDILARVFSGIDGILMRTVHLMSSSAYLRILHELSIQVARLKTTDKLNVKLPIKEYELSTYCGLSRETVSREFKKLKSRGIATIAHHKIVISDLDKLHGELDKLR